MELIQKLGLGLFGLGARRASTGSGTQGDARTRGRQARQERDSGDSQQRSGKPGRGETVGQRRRMAMRPPSFTDMLPYVSYDGDEQVFVLKDGSTLGVFFELTAVPTEAQALDFLVDHANKVQEALQALPESDASPWIVQFFLNDDRNIDGLNGALRDYIAGQHSRYPERASNVLQSPFTRSVLSEVAEHIDLASRPQGLFTDTQVTGQVWRGQQRRVRCCLYKRFASLAEDPSPATTQIEAVAVTLTATLSEAGVKTRRCNGRDLYE